MQQNKRGSILLYVLFLSSFLILFFVSFQGELEKKLEWAKDSEQNIQDISGIKDTLVFLKNTPSVKKIINSNEHLSLVSIYQSGSIFSQKLGWNDSHEYWITSTGWSTSIMLNIAVWGPISYRLAAFNSGSESSSVLISSGITVTSVSINLSPILNTHILFIDSLGGFVHYTLNTNTTTIIPSSSSYRLERDINGYKKDGGIYDIVHFLPRSRSGIDYQKMGMYLKE